MDLGTFLQDPSMQPASVTSIEAEQQLTCESELGSWADEMEDMPLPCKSHSRLSWCIR